MRKLMSVLGAVAVAGAGLVATTPSAQGSVYLGIYAIKARNANYCAADSDDGLWAAPCNPRNRVDQQWDTTAPPNTRVFSNRGWINDCLDDSINGLNTVRCNGTTYQRFTLVKLSNGSVELKNVNTRNCVTFSGGNLYASTCRSLASQQFVLVRI
ncbi:MAG TPA: hypothetical protein VGL36_21945 [Kribbella sp.]